LLAVFFAPISGYFIGIYDLVTVMRILFGITFVSMTAKFVIFYILSTETGQGKIKLEETRDVPVWKLLLEYKAVMVRILRTPATWRVLIIISLLNIQQMTSANFFGLYVTQDLGIPEQFLALFPILRSGIMLLFFLNIQDRLNRYPQYIVMLVGLGAYITGFTLLVVTPPQTMTLLIIFIIMDACAASLFLPRRDALVIQNVVPEERARIMSLLLVIMLGVSSPFGYIIGVLSEIDRRIPFIVCIGLFVLMGIMVYMEKGNSKKEAQAHE